jgi:hypothetical protein
MTAPPSEPPMSAGWLRREGRFRNLTLSMVLLMLLNPFLSMATSGRLVGNAIMSLIFFFGIVAVSDSKKLRLVALGLGVPWFVLTWSGSVASQPSFVLRAAATGLAIAFFAFTVTVILAHLVRAKRVTQDVLWGAVTIYLMLGALWYTIYMLLELMHPGSFLDAVAGEAAQQNDLLYFSFVTLTTLGYGDIVPITRIARHVAVIEAVVGVMYLAMVISRLVALFISQSEPKRTT